MSTADMAVVDAALEDLLAAMAVRFPFRTAVLRRIARRPKGRAMVIAGVLRSRG